jgi:2-polyprenyl-3-methyl-5-hydroxy-6-metoxy-1,4-benzoquinol methylase
MEYSLNYWDYQKKIGEFGGRANFYKFKNFVKESDQILDFGCGGGYLLENFNCKIKHGLEINDVAREFAESKGLKIFKSLNEISENYYDLIISNHALEHCERPLDELKTLYNKLKPGGRIIFYVPNDSIIHNYDPLNPNQHLYTWNAQCLGNLFNHAGFKIISCKKYVHRWPPKYRFIEKVFGPIIFDFCSRVYGLLSIFTLCQVRIICKK